MDMDMDVKRGSLAFLLLLLLAVAPATALEGFALSETVDYSGCDLAAYEQDVVIHRSAGTGYEETVDGTNVWHIFVGANCREDYGDIRFLSSSGAEVPYYLWPDYSAEIARFTVRLSGAGGTLTVWYENPSAATTSSGTATFIEFVDLEGGLAGWAGTGISLIEPGYGGSGAALQTAQAGAGRWATLSWEASRTVSLPAHPVEIAVVAQAPGNNGGANDVAHALGLDGDVLASNSKAIGWQPLRATGVSADGERTLRLISTAYWHSGTKISQWDNVLVRAYSATPPSATAFSGPQPAPVAPIAAFSAAPTSGVAPLAVQFMDTSRYTPTSWHWDFGDGQTSTEQHPSHIYAAPGNYTATLMVTNPYGSDLATRTDLIHAAAVATIWDLPGSAWAVVSDGAFDVGTPTYPIEPGRSFAAHGAAVLPDGGVAVVIATSPETSLSADQFSPAPMHWRVLRLDAGGNLLWGSDHFEWQQGNMPLSGGGNGRPLAPQEYDAKILPLSDGNLLVLDSVPCALTSDLVPSASGYGVYSQSAPKTWIRKLDGFSGATIWEREIDGYAIRDACETDAGYRAAATGGASWYYPKYSTFIRCNPAEKAVMLSLNETGALQSVWNIHTEPTRYYSSSIADSLVRIPGEAERYWVFGAKSPAYYNYGDPAYGTSKGCQPHADLIDYSAGTAQRFQLTPETSEGQTAWRTASGILPSGIDFKGYPYARALSDRPLVIRALPDGGAIVRYQLQGSNFWEPGQTYLARIGPDGALLWQRGYDLPVQDVQVLPAGNLLALFQGDNGLVRVSRLNETGALQQSVWVGDLAGRTTGYHLVPNGEGYVVAGQTTGFGGEGAPQALLIATDRFESVLLLGVGSVSIDREVLYKGEKVVATVNLKDPDFDACGYSLFLENETGTVYQTWDVLAGQMTVEVPTWDLPAGPYWLRLMATHHDLGVTQTLAWAPPFVARDIGAVWWDYSAYGYGDVGYVNYEVYEPDYGNYSYWLRIRAPGGILQAEYRLPTAGAISFQFDIPLFGDYFADLIAIRKSDDVELWGQVATAELWGETAVYGTIYDRWEQNAVSGATVHIRQPGSPNATLVEGLTGFSGADGTYLVEGLLPGYEAIVNVSAGGYRPYSEPLFVSVSGSICRDVALVREDPAQNPGIVGYAAYPPRGNPAPGIQIIVDGPSGKKTTTTRTPSGYFEFQDLGVGTYSLWAENETGGVISSVRSISLVSGEIRSIELDVTDPAKLPRVAFTASPTSGKAPLAVNFVDLSTSEYDITARFWEFGDGSKCNAGERIAYEYLSGGHFDVSLTVENYYGAKKVTKLRYIDVDGPVPAAAPSRHQVRFLAQTGGGLPLAGLNVTATPLKSTGFLGWLLELLGIPGEVDPLGTALAGVSGSDGATVFSMIESVQYRVQFTDPARGIDTSVTIHPKEDQYLITFWVAEPGTHQAGDVRYDLFTDPAGDLTTTLGVRYNDTLQQTRSLTFTVRDEAGGVIHQETVAKPQATLTYTMTTDPGHTYTFGFVADHATRGEIKQDRVITFRPEDRPLIDLAPWIPRSAYHWASVLLIGLFATAFMVGEVRGGMLTIPVLALVLAFIGWFDVPWVIVIGALVIGVLIFSRFTEGDLRI